MNDTNVGLGMVPHKKGCRCDECTIERQAAEITALRARVAALERTNNYLNERIGGLAKIDKDHCRDCCCARSWTALGITEYTGRSIPEHIEMLRAEIERLTRERDALVKHPTMLGLSCEVARLRAALRGLHDDIAEYQRINHLGGYNNHWMREARAAIAGASEAQTGVPSDSASPAP